MCKRRRFVYLLLFFLVTINYFTRTTLSVAAQPIATEFHLSPIAMGYLLSSYSWTYLLSLIPVGALVDRFGTLVIAAAGITLWSAATMATALSATFGVLLLTRLITGSGEATSYPAGMGVVREWAPASERGIATAFLNGGAYAGPALGALLTGFLVADFGWRWSFFVAGAIGFLWLIPWLWWFRAPERARFLSEPERQMILGTRDTPSAQQGESSSVLQLLGSRVVWGMALVQGCAVYAQYLFLTWLPSYLQVAKGLTVKSSGIDTAIPYIASVFLATYACHLSDRFLRKGNLERGSRRFAVALMLVFSSVILVTPFVDSLWVIILLVTLSLSGVSSAVSLNFALATDVISSPRDTGKVASILLVGGNAFGLLAPIVTGYVIAATKSYNWAFVVAGLLLIGGAALAVLMSRPAGCPSGEGRLAAITQGTSNPSG